MIEAGAHEASESDMLDALMFGQNILKNYANSKKVLLK